VDRIGLSPLERSPLGHPLEWVQLETFMTDRTSKANSNLGFFDIYRRIGRWTMGPGVRTHIGDESLVDDKNRRVCRFCLRTTPAVTFNKEAHAVPQLFGNRSLLSVYECDDCNQKFGIRIENDLGNWTKPYRTMLLVPGKGGVPSIKDRGAERWRIDGHVEGDQRELETIHWRNEGPFRIDENQHLHITELTRDPYTPAGVMKAFVRVGLTLMPDPELAYFPELMAWIQNPDHKAAHIGAWSWVYETLRSERLPDNQVRAGLYRRENDEGPYPYMFLILAFAHHLYQVPLFSSERDAHLEDMHLAVPTFPIPPPDGAEPGKRVQTFIDLSGTDVVKGEKVEIRQRYGERKEVTGMNP
jgi:hypothetical protein